MKLSVEQYIEIGKHFTEAIHSAFDGIYSNAKDLEEDTPVETEDGLIDLEGAEPPWLVEALKWEGLNESDDRDRLEPFLGINPDDSAGGQAWCADFINACMKKCGIAGTGSSAAVSFENWGTACGCIDGAIAVYGPGAIKGGHVGIVVGDGLFGGNQGDMVRLNKNRAWFDTNTISVSLYRISGVDKI